MVLVRVLDFWITSVFCLFQSEPEVCLNFSQKCTHQENLKYFFQQIPTFGTICLNSYLKSLSLLQHGTSLLKDLCHVYSETNHSTISLACDNGLYLFIFSDCYTHSFACVDMPITLLQLSLLLTSKDLDSVPCSATKFSVGMGKSLSEEVTFTSPVDSHGT